MMAVNLDELFGKAARASEDVMIVRDEARAEAVLAIRDIERRLRDAIAGDVLRGLRNLHRQYDGRPVRGGSVRWGARVVRGPGPATEARVDAAIEFGTSCMVVTKDGELAIFGVDERGVFTSRPVDDDELVAQDLDCIAATVALVLERHCAAAERTSSTYGRLSELATLIRKALR